MSGGTVAALIMGLLVLVGGIVAVVLYLKPSDGAAEHAHPPTTHVNNRMYAIGGLQAGEQAIGGIGGDGGGGGAPIQQPYSASEEQTANVARNNTNIGAGLEQEGDYAEIEDVETGGNSSSTNHPANVSRCKYRQGNDSNGKQCNTKTASKWCEKHSCGMVNCPNSKPSRAKVCAACQHQIAGGTADDDDYLEPSAEQVDDYDNGLVPGASDPRASGSGSGGGGGGGSRQPAKDVAHKRAEKQQRSVYLGFGQEEDNEESML